MSASTMSSTAGLEPLLRCPRCLRGGLARGRAGWTCGVCSSGYPEIGGIPWLFAEPRAALAEWRSRTQLLLTELEREAATIGEEQHAPGLRARTRERLERLQHAYADQAARLRALLAPLGSAGVQPTPGTLLALRTRLPIEQGLASYYPNLHRDWCWGEEENAASIALLTEALGSAPLGRLLVLGAGAGRLASDLHERRGASITVALDFNPLLLFVASRVLSGESLELYEFPIAPRRLEDVAVLRTLRAARPLHGQFFLVAADALRVPCMPASFDTVVTPWFIDIVPESLPALATRINELLAPGGRWVNFGSLVFARGIRAERFSTEEALEVVIEAGFEAPLPLERELPYMRSPASRHSRLETVIAWGVRKERGATAAPTHGVLPEWLVRSDLPVPALGDFRFQAATARIHAFLMALIDGKRTVADMARLLVEQRLMAPQDAEPAVRNFLTRMYEDAQQRGAP